MTTTCVTNLYEVDIEVNLTDSEFEPNDSGRQISKEIKILDYFYGTLLLCESDGRNSLTLIMYGVKYLQPRRVELAAEPFYGLKTFNNGTIRRRERNSIDPRGVGQSFLSLEILVDTRETNIDICWIEWIIMVKLIIEVAVVLFSVFLSYSLLHQSFALELLQSIIS